MQLASQGKLNDLTTKFNGKTPGSFKLLLLFIVTIILSAYFIY